MGTYSYQVATVNTAGMEGPKSAPVRAVAWDQALSPSAKPPAPPTALTVTAENERRVALTWKPSSDLAAGVGGYGVYRDEVPIAVVTGTNYEDVAGLRPSTRHSYRITAMDQSSRESAPSEPVKVTTPADAAPPKVIHIFTPTTTSVVVFLDEPVDPASATASASYALSDGFGVARAELHGDAVVMLTTAAPLPERTALTLTLQGLRDQSQPAHAPAKPQPLPFTVTTAPVLLSQNRPVRASTSQLSPVDVNDGDDKTRWSSHQDFQPQWIQIDLEELRPITRVVLKWETLGEHGLSLSDDGRTWKPVPTAVRKERGDEVHTLSVTARFVRVDCRTSGPHGNSSLWEFQVFGPAGAMVMDGRGPAR
jgi:hypothetical protein